MVIITIDRHSDLERIDVQSSVIDKEIKGILERGMPLQGRSAGFTRSTPLLGALPELDSMSVLGIITALEDHFGFTIHDDEIDGATFATFGSLVDFVTAKSVAR